MRAGTVMDRLAAGHVVLGQVRLPPDRVRVIHGRGFGSRSQEPVLKSMVHSWLVQKEEVVAFCQARPSEGGEGALIVLLRAALQPSRERY